MMKKVIVFVLLLNSIGCINHTEYGKCIGVVEDKNPKLEYKINIWNAVVSITFYRALFPLYFWLSRSFECPVGYNKNEARRH